MENLKFAIVGIIILIVAFFAGDAFFGLVGDLYRFLDGYIWAFFAGIMAFFIALWFVIMMIYITLAIATFAIFILASIFE